MSDLVGNPEDRFSYNEAHMLQRLVSYNHPKILSARDYSLKAADEIANSVDSDQIAPR